MIIHAAIRKLIVREKCYIIDGNNRWFILDVLLLKFKLNCTLAGILRSSIILKLLEQYYTEIMSISEFK